jgi:hypothetical protein
VTSLTWIKLKLPANWEEQKEIHRNLRKDVQNLVKLGVLNSFVMTYHIKERDSSFHLCFDLPKISECSLKVLEGTSHMNRILDVIRPYLSRQKAAVLNYLEETIDGQKEQLSHFKNITRVGMNQEAFAIRLIENASRGCKAALEILDNNISLDLNPIILYDLVMKKCSPLNGGLWFSDSAHFCFNSLGFNLIEEYAIRGYPVLPPNEMVMHATNAVIRLLNREGIASIEK